MQTPAGPAPSGYLRARAPLRSIRGVTTSPSGNQPTSLRAAQWRTAGFLFALAGGFTATISRDGATWFGLRGPPCPLGACFGSVACPGCGLLRSTAAALHGDLSLAWATHPAGPVVALLLLGGAALHLDILRRRCEVPWHRIARRFGHVAFATAVLLGWTFRAPLP